MPGRRPYSVQDKAWYLRISLNAGPILLLLILAVFIRIVANPMANVFQKQLAMAGYAPLFINWLTYAGLGILVTYWAFLLRWSSLPSAFWWYAVASACVGATGNGFLVKALEKGELSVLGPINAYKSVLGTLTAVVVLGEWPGIWGVLGMLMIICGSYLVLDSNSEKFSLAILRRKDIAYRLLAMVLTAIEAVFLKKMIMLSSPGHAFIVWCWFGAVVSLVVWKVYSSSGASYRLVASDTVIKYLLLIACIALMQFTTIFTFDHMPVGYALALFQLSILLTVWMGHHYFGEKGLRRKLIGSVIMMLGAVGMILTGQAG